jgi:hypothetical protein
MNAALLQLLMACLDASPKAGLPKRVVFFERMRLSSDVPPKAAADGMPRRVPESWSAKGSCLFRTNAALAVMFRPKQLLMACLDASPKAGLPKGVVFFERMRL